MRNIQDTFDIFKYWKGGGLMKTKYERLADYGINNLVFGKAKKRAYHLFWLLILLIIFMEWLIKY
ncbi:MAG: hypothetical protein JJU28_21120 [Cyclobacteriaceae bacterium]|nr:hypothetical protein [Cyclobacteriaceae bacterium]